MAATKITYKVFSAIYLYIFVVVTLFDISWLRLIFPVDYDQCDVKKKATLLIKNKNHRINGTSTLYTYYHWHYISHLNLTRFNWRHFTIDKSRRGMCAQYVIVIANILAIIFYFFFVCMCISAHICSIFVRWIQYKVTSTGSGKINQPTKWERSSKRITLLQIPQKSWKIFL